MLLKRIMEKKKSKSNNFFLLQQQKQTDKQRYKTPKDLRPKVQQNNDLVNLNSSMIPNSENG